VHDLACFRDLLSWISDFQFQHHVLVKPQTPFPAISAGPRELAGASVVDDHREKPVADTGMTPIMPFTGFPSRLGCEAAFRNLSRDHGLVNLHACCLHV
jgi:hypothetical protein